MAKMLMPTGSVTSTQYGQGDFGANSGNVGDEDNREQNLERQQHLRNLNITDPRLTNEQRLDQRYSNYTFGSDPNYAQNTASRLQQTGTGTYGILGGFGQNAAAAGQAAQGRVAPTTDYGLARGQMMNAQGVALNQGDLYGRLMAFADDGSAAQAQLQAATNQGMANNLAMARSGRGMGGSAAGMQAAQFANAQQAAQAANNSALLRAQQQAQAYGLGSQVLGQRGDLYSRLGQMYGDQSQFQTDAALRAQAQNDQAALGFGGQAIDAYQAGAGAQLGYEGEARANYAAELGAGMGYEENATNILLGRQTPPESGTDWLGTALGVTAAVAPAIIAASDVRNKTRIQGEDLSSTYRALGGQANANDFTPAGWYQHGDRYQQIANRRSLEQRDANIAAAEGLKAEREKQDDDRKKTASVWSQALSGAATAIQGRRR